MTLRAADLDDRPSTNGTAKVTNGVSRIRRALLEEPLATQAGGDVVRQEVPGTCVGCFTAASPRPSTASVAAARAA